MLWTVPHKVCWVALLAVLGCTTPSTSVPDQRGSSGIDSEAPKAITAVALAPIRAFGAWTIVSAGGTFSLHEIHSGALVTRDNAGKLAPRLLAKIPTLDDGSIKILPDGRMQTMWQLQPNAKWHDGVPFTADDLAFTRQVHLNREVPLQPSLQIDQIDQIEVTGPSSAVVTWKGPFFQANLLGLRQFWPLPKHLLAGPFEGDKSAFISLPYWTSEYVHLGPFRLVDYGLGENLTFERVDDYFLGRPKVRTIFIRIIPDEGTVFANLQAGAIDIVPEQALSPDILSDLREEWRRTGGGTVVDRQGTWRFLSVQFDPESGRPPELSRDVRIRHGLYEGFDRHALREALLPGFAATNPDSFMEDADVRAPVVGKPFARYQYDHARAAQLLAEAGWRRAGDQRLLNQAGQQVQITIRTAPGYYKEGSIVAQYWRDLGIEVAEENLSPALVRDLEYLSRFSGFEANARSSGDQIFVRFDSRNHPTPQNRYTGPNTGSYANPGLDRLIDRLYATIDEREQALLLKDMGEILAMDLPVLPTYYQVNLAAVRKGVRALVDDYAGGRTPALASRNAHLWDRD